MHSSTSSFERTIPAASWKTIFLATVLIAAGATLVWELYVRSQGYKPTLNDSAYLWADEREKLQDDSLVLLGASRILFDTDLDVLEEGLGRKPLQLALTGATFVPVLENIEEDRPNFKGTILIGIVPPILTVAGGPLFERPLVAIETYKTRTPSERFGQKIALHLEENIAFLKQEDLTLKIMLQHLPIPNRSYAHVPPRLPPYFAVAERNRRYRMIDEASQPGELQDLVRSVWPPLFSPPPAPSYVPEDVFMNALMEAGKAQFEKTVALVNRMRERGCKIVFIRYPSTGLLREIERKAAPRDQVWDPFLQLTQCPGIHFEDYPELAGFDCPEWSHLSNEDSIEFTKRLIPHLKKALETY